MGFIKHLKQVYFNSKNKSDKSVTSNFFSNSLTENLEYFKREFNDTADLSIKYIDIRDDKERYFYAKCYESHNKLRN